MYAKTIQLTCQQKQAFNTCSGDTGKIIATYVQPSAEKKQSKKYENMSQALTITVHSDERYVQWNAIKKSMSCLFS